MTPTELMELLEKISELSSDRANTMGFGAGNISSMTKDIQETMMLIMDEFNTLTTDVRLLQLRCAESKRIMDVLRNALLLDEIAYQCAYIGEPDDAIDQMEAMGMYTEYLDGVDFDTLAADKRHEALKATK